MMRCNRPAEPEVLRVHGATWTKAYVDGVARGKTDFSWPSASGKPLNHHLKPLLKEMTDSHCAYCDWFPLEAGGRETIDHFRPRRHAPELAFTWSNLYLACDGCQAEKHDHLDDMLLRPDEPGYDFEAIFIVDFTNGELAPNPAAPSQLQERARVSIDIFGLNRRGRPTERQKLIRRLLMGDEIDKAVEPYRYLHAPTLAVQRLE